MPRNEYFTISKPRGFEIRVLQENFSIIRHILGIKPTTFEVVVTKLREDRSEWSKVGLEIKIIILYFQSLTSHKYVYKKIVVKIIFGLLQNNAHDFLGYIFKKIKNRKKK